MPKFESKVVLQYDCNGVFKRKFYSIYRASQKLNIDGGHICRAIKTNSTAGGFYWKYATGEIHDIVIKIKPRRGKKVDVFLKGNHICTSCNLIEASELTEISVSTIRLHLDGLPIKGYDFTFKLTCNKEKKE
jgi:hypothetical protein